MFRFGTLHLTPSLHGIVLRAAAIFVLVVVACEALVRIPGVQAQLPLPALPGHYELGPKQYLADRLYETSGGIDPAGPGTADTGLYPASSGIDPAGPGTTDTGLYPASSGIDCFFIGSSVIGRSVIPEDFSAAYHAQTGKRITCFNFGLDTLTFTGAQRLSEILIKRYHPRLIIFGVHFENFTTSDANQFDLDTPWARYQLGAPDPEGWLESNLLVYRDALTAAQIPKDFEESVILTSVLSPYGYYPADATADLHKLKPRDDPDFFAILDTINIAAHRPALDALLATDTGDTQLVMVDMPMSPMTSRAVIHFGYDYQGYLDAISQDAQASGVLLIPVAPSGLIGDEGYQDTIHMNTAGASLFSTWLGEQIAAAERDGRIK